jgi:mono/diheme cytochrome c family protein
MTTSKIPWLAAFVCVSLFSACGPERPAAPPAAGDAGSAAADELYPGFLPDLADLWSEERKDAPQRVSRETVPDYLSRAKRHREFMQGDVPLEYRGGSNPYPATTRIILDGGRLYKSHCAACHGATGLGGGEVSRDLTPPPALLAYLIDRPRSADKYLLWTISEGGAPFDTEMPAFKAVLTERQIWQTIIYMRAGFPNVEEAGQN